MFFVEPNLVEQAAAPLFGNPLKTAGWCVGGWVDGAWPMGMLCGAWGCIKVSVYQEEALLSKGLCDAWFPPLWLLFWVMYAREGQGRVGIMCG